MRFDELVLWHIAVGQFEQEEETAEERWAREENMRLSWEAEGIGVRFCEDEEEGWEDEEADDEVGETSFLSPLLRRDVGSARYLTEPSKVLRLGDDTLVRDFHDSITWLAHSSWLKSNRTFDRDDLKGEAWLALLNALPSFNGRGSLGGFADRVVSNALVDFYRRERHHQRATSIEEVDQDLDGDDPTEQWVGYLDLLTALPKIPDSSLLVLQAFGFKSQEIGDPTVIDMRRSRARKRLLEVLEDSLK